MTREEAYVWVQRNAMRSHDERLEFKELLLQDADVMRVLTREEVDRLFDLTVQLRHVDTIFERVFGQTPAPAGA